MPRFWDKKKLEKAEEALKKSYSLDEAASTLAKELKMPIDADCMWHAIKRHKGISPGKLLRYDINKWSPPWWTKERVDIAEKVLNESETIFSALKKMEVKFGKKITQDSVRSALWKHGKESKLNNLINKKGKLVNYGDDDTCDSLVAILNKHITLKGALEELNKKFSRPFSHKTISRILKKKYGDLTIVTQFLKQDTPKADGDEGTIKSVMEFVKKRDKKPLSFRDICDEFDMSPKRMEFILDKALAYGYQISFDDDKLYLKRAVPEEEKATPKVDIPASASSRLRFGVISDTHFGSKAVLAEKIKYFVNTAYDEYGIRTILHCGDIVAGNHVYKGQAAELSHWTCQEQCEEACNILPERKGLKYVAILGNHDVDFIKSAGIDVGYVISSMRKDINVIGMLQQKFVEKNTNLAIELIHIKSSAHARSYSLEKHIYHTVTKGNQPDVVFCGHRHVNGYFEVQGIHTFMVPCFEDANLFVHYHDFLPSVGGLIVDLVLDDKNQIIRCEPSFHLYKSDNKLKIDVDFKENM